LGTTVNLLSPFPNNDPHNPNVPNVIIEWFDKLRRAKSVSEKEKAHDGFDFKLLCRIVI